jgi:hypothetical protein
MDQLDRLIKMAEDELTEYSTDARKMEKLRRKIGLSVPIAEQRRCREALAVQLPKSGFRQIVEEQRQAVALPFWGLAGLGLLAGVSLSQSLGYVAAVVGTVSAYRLQKWGWELQAKRLLLNTLEDIEARITQPQPES